MTKKISKILLAIVFATAVANLLATGLATIPLSKLRQEANTAEGFDGAGSSLEMPKADSVQSIDREDFTLSKLRQETNFALWLDGTGSYLEMPKVDSVQSIDRGDFTFEVWVKGIESEQPAHPQIMSNRLAHGQGFTFGFHNRWRNSPNKIPYIQLEGVNWIGYPNPPNLLDGKWHHFAVRKQNNTLTYFVNGVSVGSFTTPKIGTASIAADRPLWIGWDFANQHQTSFKGYLDELRIWNRALDESEIKAGMFEQLRGNESGLVGYWPFNNGVEDVRDRSRHNRHTSTFGAYRVPAEIEGYKNVP